MTLLVKEGLLERTPKRGTFVAQRSKDLTHVAIYLPDNIWQLPAAVFKRAVVAAFCERLKERRIVPDLWIDSRPKAEQDFVWSELATVAEQRRFQAVMHCYGGDEHQLKWLRRLPVPLVGVTSTPYRNCVYLEQGSSIAVKELAHLGCRRVGMIAPRGRGCKETQAWNKAVGIRDFRQTAAELGLEIREEWIEYPPEMVDEQESEHYGFVAMRQQLALPQRPDGYFVTHDWVARGALMAVMGNQIKVPDELKLVLHRNREIPFLCPVQVSFVEYSVATLVDGLMHSLDAQLRGEELEPIRLSPTISLPTEESTSPFVTTSPTLEAV